MSATLKAAAQQALEALEDLHANHGITCAGTLSRLRAALEQPEQEPEPVAWRTFDGEGGYDYRAYDDNETYAQEWNQRNPRHAGWVEPLYTHPPREQEPVAWLRRDELADLQTCNYRHLGADSPRIWAPHQPDAPGPELVPVYAAPPQREPLTDEQIDAGIEAWFTTGITTNDGKDRGHPFRQRMRAAIERAHGISAPKDAG
jgi:hypothetical protein